MRKNIEKCGLQISIICQFSLFFTACQKPETGIPAGPQVIIIEASVPSKIYTNTKQVYLDANKTISLNRLRTLFYSWDCTSFPAATGRPEIKNPLQAFAWVENLGIGQYKFQLIVKDNLGNIADSIYSLDVLEDTLVGIVPIVKAGPDQVINAPRPDVNLNGYETIFFNAAARALNFKWRVIKQPAGSIQVEIYSDASPVSDAFGLEEGVYQFSLEVRNEVGAIGADTMQVTVLPDPLKGTTRIFEDRVWEKREIFLSPYVSIEIKEQDFFRYRNNRNMEVRVWDEQKREWSDSKKYGWYADSFGLTIPYPWNEDEKIYLKEVGKKTRVQVKFL